jgi:putative ABC transport system ATP-binding protein
MTADASGAPVREDADAAGDADADHVVELRRVWKRYETGGEVVEALRGVDFVADAGEFVSVMGPSGSGKSTMLNVLGLLDAPSEGTVLLAGRDVTGLTDAETTDRRKRFVGFVFQNFHLIPTLSALENVEVPTLFGSDPTARQRATDLLTRLGLGDRLDHRPDQLSGGQKQRVAIARSLINRPRLLLADEPTGNLDRETGRAVLEEFTRIKEEEDVAIVAVTHDQQVSNFADRTIHLVDGRIYRDTAASPLDGVGTPSGGGSADDGAATTGPDGGSTRDRDADRASGAGDALDAADETAGGGAVDAAGASDTGDLAPAADAPGDDHDPGIHPTDARDTGDAGDGGDAGDPTDGTDTKDATDPTNPTDGTDTTDATDPTEDTGAGGGGSP